VYIKSPTTKAGDFSVSGWIAFYHHGVPAIQYVPHPTFSFTR